MPRQNEVAIKTQCVTRELPGCRVVAHTLQAGRIAMHRVDRPLVAAIVAGRCDTTIGGLRLESDEGNAWSEPAGERRANQVVGRPARVLAVLPDERDPSGLFDGLHPVMTRPTLRTSADIAIAARLAWGEFGARDSAASLALTGHVLVLAAAFARRPNARHHDPRPAWLSRVSDYLRAHYREPFTLSDVAAIAGVAPAHLCRVFRAHTGSTVAEYVRRLRVEWAVRRIAAGDMSLAEIALRAGFADQSHLTKIFRRQLGITPAVYRARTCAS